MISRVSPTVSSIRFKNGAQWLYAISLTIHSFCVAAIMPNCASFGTARSSVVTINANCPSNASSAQAGWGCGEVKAMVECGLTSAVKAWVKAGSTSAAK